MRNVVLRLQQNALIYLYGISKLNEEKSKTSFYVRNSTMAAIKYISFIDGKTQSDIIDEVLTKYVSEWEKKNGAIPKKKD